MQVHGVKELVTVEEIGQFLFKGFEDYVKKCNWSKQLTTSQCVVAIQQVFGSEGPPVIKQLMQGPIYQIEPKFDGSKGLRPIPMCSEDKILVFYRYRLLSLSLQFYDFPGGRKCVKGFEFSREQAERYNDACIIASEQQEAEMHELSDYTSLIKLDQLNRRQMDEQAINLPLNE